jgi:hypothetical protein
MRGGRSRSSSRWLVPLTALLTVCAFEGSGAPALAQVTVGGTVGLSVQSDGQSDSPYLGPGFGGSALAIDVFVDADLAPRLSVGGEVSIAGEIQGEQQQRVPGGNNTLSSRHHDTILSGVVKFTSPVSQSFQVALVGGIGAGWRQTHRAGTFRAHTPPFTPVPVEEQTLSTVAFAATVGADSAVAITRRTAMIFIARWHWLADDDRRPDGVVARGVSSLITRLGVGMRVRF